MIVNLKCAPPLYPCTESRVTTLPVRQYVRARNEELELVQRCCEQGMCGGSAQPLLHPAMLALKRSMHDLSYVVCSLIARYVLFQNVTASRRRRRLSSIGFNAHEHLPAFGRDQWVQVRSGLVWGFSCQAVVLGVLTVFCSERERPFFVPSPAIRSPERAEGVKGPKR